MKGRVIAGRSCGLFPGAVSGEGSGLPGGVTGDTNFLASQVLGVLCNSWGTRHNQGDKNLPDAQVRGFPLELDLDNFDANIAIIGVPFGLLYVRAGYYDR